jgi:hypothetical protein
MEKSISSIIKRTFLKSQDISNIVSFSPDAVRKRVCFVIESTLLEGCCDGSLALFAAGADGTLFFTGVETRASVADRFFGMVR